MDFPSWIPIAAFVLLLVLATWGLLNIAAIYAAHRDGEKMIIGLMEDAQAKGEHHVLIELSKALIEHRKMTVKLLRALSGQKGKE